MPQKIRMLLLALLAILGLAVGSLVLSARRPPLPNPKGDEDFLKAAAMVRGNVGYQANFLDHDDLRALVSGYGEALRLIRLGLNRSCSAASDSTLTNIVAAVKYVDRLRFLPRLLLQEGRLAETEGRFAEAAHSYIDALRLGTEISRVGFLINTDSGIAFEAIGDDELCKLVPRLDVPKLRLLIPQLEDIDCARIRTDEIRRKEGRFPRYELNKRSNPAFLAQALWDDWHSTARAEVIHKRSVARLRLLTIEVALRCYLSDHGRPPPALDQLLPKYMQRVPLDPFSGRPLIYHPQSTSWLLYSVDEDGLDDGGKTAGRPVPGTVTRRDLFYDS